jgi:hypothetical protein
VRLERDRVWVFGNLGKKTTGSEGVDGSFASDLLERYAGNRLVVREEGNVGNGVNMTEVVDLYTNDTLSRGRNLDREDRA